MMTVLKMFIEVLRTLHTLSDMRMNTVHGWPSSRLNDVDLAHFEVGFCRGVVGGGQCAMIAPTKCMHHSAGLSLALCVRVEMDRIAGCAQ